MPSNFVAPRRLAGPRTLVAELVREAAAPISEIDGSDLGSLVERVGDSRLVLIGEASHGTSEFYRMRVEITKELIKRRGCRFVAIEADWPDAARIDQYVRRLAPADGHRALAHL